MKIDKKVLKKRVEAGAAFLNVVHPGWQKKVNTKILDLGSGSKCILGELYDGYADGQSALGLAYGEAQIHW